MKIKIKNPAGPNLFVPVPLFFLKSRLLWKIISKYGGEDAAKFAPMGTALIRELNRFVKRNGHFVLVDVQNADGSKIEIYV